MANKPVAQDSATGFVLSGKVCGFSTASRVGMGVYSRGGYLRWEYYLSVYCGAYSSDILQQQKLRSSKSMTRTLLQRPVDLVVVKAIKNRYFLQAIDRERELLYAA